MANLLDEVTGPVNEAGRDINVIEKKIPVTVGVGSKIFEVLLWVCLIIPGLVFLFKKIKARTYLEQLEQKIQGAASTYNNYLDQRVQILSNLAQLVNKSVELDKDTYVAIAQARSGKPVSSMSEEDSITLAKEADTITNKINIAMENYPELKSHSEIRDAIQQNSYTQKEITAARELYNDLVKTWNTQIFVWPTNRIVAAKQGYETRIPFSVSSEIKAEAKKVFF